MARKYKFHRYYSVVWQNFDGVGIHAKDELTLKEARETAKFMYESGAFRVDVVKRLASQDRVKGVAKLENL